MSDSSFKFFTFDNDKNNTKSIINNEEIIKKAQKLYIYLIGFELTSEVEKVDQNEDMKVYENELEKNKKDEGNTLFLGKVLKNEGQLNCKNTNLIINNNY